MDDRAAGARQRAGETKRRRTREAILAAASREFDARGFDAVSMTDVAAAAGVSAASAYSHFPAKAMLGAWVLRSHLAEAIDPAAFADGSPVDALDRFLDLLTRGCCRNPRLTVELSLTAARLRAERASVQPHDVIPTVRVATGIVARGQQEGVFLPFPDPETAAFTVSYVLLGRLTYMRPTDSPDMAADMSLLVRTLARRLLLA